MLHGAPNSRLVHYTAIIFMLCLATSGAARPIAADDLMYDMAVEPHLADRLRPVTSGDEAGCSAFKLDGYKFYRGTDLPGKSTFCAPLGRLTAYEVADQCTHQKGCAAFNIFQAEGEPPSFCFNDSKGPMKPAYDTIAKGKCQGVYVPKGADASGVTRKSWDQLKVQAMRGTTGMSSASSTVSNAKASAEA